jgi:hypothetical protein
MHLQEMWKGWQYIHGMLFLGIPTYTSLRMALGVCSYLQIWSHSVGALWLGWMVFECNNYVPVLSDPIYARPRHVEWVATHPWFMVLHVTTYTNLRKTWWFCSFLPNLIPQLGYYMAWMDRIPVYWLIPRLSGPFWCTHKIWWMAGNTSVAFASSCSDIHHPEDCVVVLRNFSTDLACSFGALHLGWTSSQCISHLLCPRFVKPYIYILKICGIDCIISTTFGYSCHNVHHPDDGMVFLQFLQNIIPLFGLSVAWMDRITVYWMCPRFVRYFPCTHKICVMGGNTTM